MKAKTKIRKAADFLRKAVRALRGRADVLRARLLFLVVEVREEPLPPHVGEVDTATVHNHL